MNWHFLIMTIGTFLLWPGISQGDSTKIKVAVIENLKFEKLSTDKYASDYMDGLETAVGYAKSHDYEVEIKTFTYDKEPLAILGIITNVQAWAPDLIIGPRSSSLFLLLRGQFSNILVLSPFATASDVAKLPDNFYSMTLPNEYFTRAVVNLVTTRYKGRAVAPIGEVDCKNCMDFIQSFSNTAAQVNVTVRPATTFLNKNAETSKPEYFLKNSQADDIFLVPNTSYTSGIVVSRIAEFKKSHSLVFIGGDGWGDWSSTYVGRLKSDFDYTALRVTPWSLDAKDERTVTFQRLFKALRKRDATGSASLLSYATLMAAINALEKYSKKQDRTTIRAEILESFAVARAKTANYGRPTNYSVYRVHQSGETYDGQISAITN